MRVVTVDPVSPDAAAIEDAAQVVLDGGLIVYPTDTVYGIGCLLRRDCVDRVFQLKGRQESVPLSVAFASVEEVMHYTRLNDEQEEAIRKGHREHATFIVEKNEKIPDYVTAGLPTVGVRVPNSTVCRMLIGLTGPIVSTSANPSGEKAPASVEELNSSVAEGVDLVLDAGKCGSGRPSKITDLASGRVVRD